MISAWPQSLQNWVPWIIQSQPAFGCTRNFAAAGTLELAAQEPVCFFVSPLTVKLNADGASFSLELTALQKVFVALPGDAAIWPLDVLVDGIQAPVMPSPSGLPGLYLEPGTHSVQGELVWTVQPQKLSIPLVYGPVVVERPAGEENGREQIYIDDNNDLWLVSKSDKKASKPASLQVQVYRKLLDDQPKQLFTRVILDVAGDSREALLSGFKLPGFELIDLISPLPAKIESDGALKIQLQPGSFTISAVFRQTTESSAYSVPPVVDKSWPSQEIWVVESKPSLRRIEIDGEAIDPDRTLLPADWKGLPAFMVSPETPLLLKELDRGIGKVKNSQLSQDSTVWLGFDAREWLWLDRLTGTLADTWRMEMASPFFLGHVELDGIPQSITQLKNSGLRGVEIRTTNVNLEAVSRLPALHKGLTYTMPASGWKLPLTDLQLQIMLPPGWWAIGAFGADYSSGTWIDRWSVWDLFLILFAGVCVLRIYGVFWGLLTLPALAIAYQANVLLLMLLIPTLLLGRPIARTGEAGSLRYRIELGRRLLRGALLATLSGFLVFYAVEQLRLTIHPQLEGELVGRTIAQDELYNMAPTDGVSSIESMGSKPYSTARKLYSPEQASKDSDRSWLYDIGDQPLQTGPAVPDWQWKSVRLRWQAAASQTESLQLLVLSDWQSALVRCLHLLMLGALLARLWLRKEFGDDSDDFPHTTLFAAFSSARRNRGDGDSDQSSLWQPGVTTRLGLVLLIGCGLLLGAPPSAMAAIPASQANGHEATGVDILMPPQRILDEMARRLEASPDCAPDCASVDSAELLVESSSVTLSLEISSNVAQVVSLPARRGWWIPHTVTINGQPVQKWHTDAQGVWQTELDRGVHTLVLKGSVEDMDQIKIYFPLLPHTVTSEVSGEWLASGVSDARLIGRELTLERTSISARRADARKNLFQDPAPTFVKVKRTLNLGVLWQVETTVERVAPARGSLRVDLPLLPGETPTGRFDTPKPGWISVTLQDKDDSASWSSNLAPRDSLQLEAPADSNWSEQWNLAVGPLWRVTYTGIAPYSVTSDGVWQPSWLPRPGESVMLDITRPEVIEGKQLTIDRTAYKKTFSQSSSSSELKINARTSRSQRFSFRLPEQAELSSVTLNGERVPQAQKRSSVDIILGFGEQLIHVEWTEPHRGMWRGTTPAIEFPVAPNNIEITAVAPGDAWLLQISGPRYGPALLFWPLLAVLLIVACIAGVMRSNPLGVGQWMLLAAGASLGWVAGLVVLLLWLTALSYRQRVMAHLSSNMRTLFQIALIALTILSFAWVLLSISRGLIGEPVDYVMGLGSSGKVLNWYIDNTAAALPKVELFWAPLWIYRTIALLWSLWLAFAMLAWLRWGWRRMTQPLPAIEPTDQDAGLNTNRNPAPGIPEAADQQPDSPSDFIYGEAEGGLAAEDNNSPKKD